ncbi:MAG: DEAD/DEAH box helicase [Nitrospirae bacterium]|nr:DEAD/DEAH box helicase [Nitrospirota bacterium]
MKRFEDLGLSEETIEALRQKGFEEPTPIQISTIPAILRGKKDIVGQAQTGTGKTAAFGLPMIELLQERVKNVQALILTPTRELAIQVSEEINSLKGNKRLSIIPVYGGQSMELQLKSLKKGVDIVAGTPGRIMDHLRRRTLKIDEITFLVLDEADEMLNMGFIDDVVEIMGYTPKDKRTMLFSATMPDEIMEIARKHMREYELFRVTKGQLTVSQTDQIYFEVSEADKFEALCRIIDIEDDFYGLVFCRTKVDVDKVTGHLIERGYDADGLHGDMSQAHREKILGRFKKRLSNILVATDVAARGIDVHDLTHVINYSLPQDPESYVHRIGRTGRAGKEGNAITFITPSEYKKLQFIQQKSKAPIRKAKLPKVKDVIESKKQRIISDLEDIIEASPAPEYLRMSGELLEENEPHEILAALLQYSFQDELDEKSYTEIEDAVVDTKGKTRLFVTQGRQDGLTREKLIDFVKDKCGCGIVSGKIRDIQILEKFSFVTLPFNEAEIILAHFKKKKRGTGPFITKAKEKKGGR